MVLRCIFMTLVWPVFFYFNIAIERYKLIVSKFYKAFITTRNNDPVAFDLAAFNGK